MCCINEILRRVLCVDAIVDAGDANSDWRLDLEEFKVLMDADFQPKEKCNTNNPTTRRLLKNKQR